jgi:parallel beta-helix repeat protein
MTLQASQQYVALNIPGKSWRGALFVLFLVALAIEPVDLQAYSHNGETASDRSSSVDVSPNMDLAHEVDAHPAATTFILHPGMYRLQRMIKPKEGDSFIGPCGKPPCTPGSQAILSGARELTSVQQVGSHYAVTGQNQHNQITADAGKCQEIFPRCNFPEDLYLDDQPLAHVSSPDDVGPGKWYFDYANHTLYFDDNSRGHKLETSIVPAAFTPGPANNVTIKGLTIEKFATPSQTGAVGGAGISNPNPAVGANWIVENNEIRLNHAYGVRINFGWQVLNNYIHDNGNLGVGGGLGGGMSETLSAIPSHVLIQGNEIARNNYAHFKTGFQAGGVKIAGSRGVVIRGNYVHDNEGPGLWADIKNYDILYDNNTVSDNTEGGIAHEISFASIVRNNRLLKNASGKPSEKSWLYGASLLSSTSQGVEAYCNTVEVSSEGGNGIDMIAQHRSPTDNQVSQNNYYHHNTVVFDGNSGVTGGAWAPMAIKQFFVNNRFDYNSYYLPDLNRRAFAWSGRMNTFREFQTEGQETHGTASGLSGFGIPNVVISSPVDGSSVSGAAEINGEVKDSSEITKVELYVDWKRQASVTDNPFRFTWDTGGVPAGPHTVAAMAYNKQGAHACYAVTLDVN